MNFNEFFFFLGGGGEGGGGLGVEKNEYFGSLKILWIFLLGSTRMVLGSFL